MTGVGCAVPPDAVREAGAYDSETRGRHLAYLDTKMTNGPVEGINNKLRVIARRAYGFHARRVDAVPLLWSELAPPLPTRI